MKLALHGQSRGGTFVGRKFIASGGQGGRDEKGGDEHNQNWAEPKITRAKEAKRRSLLAEMN